MRPNQAEFDPERHRAERRAALPIVASWLLTLPLLLIAWLRLVAPDATLELIVLNALTPWLYLPVWIGFGAGLYFRQRLLAACAGSVVVLHLLWLDPRGLVAADLVAPASSPRLRVMSANVLMVNDDTEGIAAEVLQASPDLLLVQELTQDWAERFDAADVRGLFPHRVAVPRDDSFGIGLYARRPVAIRELDLSGLPALRAELRLADRTLTVFNVHTLPPRSAEYVAIWNEMMETIVALIRREPGPVLLAGDLNVTRHHRWYRELVSLGLRDAHERRGRAWVSTWPNGRMPYPSLRLDHFLASAELEALDVREGQGRGSDHRPIIGDFSLLLR
jgi:endonuclease/exonuclease/phosphatase (EEP) superfamily protein YafD